MERSTWSHHCKQTRPIVNHIPSRNQRKQIQWEVFGQVTSTDHSLLEKYQLPATYWVRKDVEDPWDLHEALKSFLCSALLMHTFIPRYWWNSTQKNVDTTRHTNTSGLLLFQCLIHVHVAMVTWKMGKTDQLWEGKVETYCTSSVFSTRSVNKNKANERLVIHWFELGKKSKIRKEIWKIFGSIPKK